MREKKRYLKEPLHHILNKDREEMKKEEKKWKERGEKKGRSENCCQDKERVS